MTKVPHIAIICSRLDLPGGIERAIVNTSNLLAENGNKVSLIILDETSQCFFPIDPGIKIIQQKLLFGITEKGNVLTRKTSFVRDVFRLKKILKDISPDTVIATEYPFVVGMILSGAGKFSKTYSWEHHHYYELGKSFFWKRMSSRAYPKLDGVICLNSDEKKLFQSVNTNAIVIPNFISKNKQVSNLNTRQILTVARLTKIKGIDRLLKTADLVLKKHPDWKWKLIGEGEMKEEVKAFIESEGLQNKLILQQPLSHDISSQYATASIYAMTSRNECFPMVLLEAMSSGLPCVAFDCETGPRHIIDNSSNGLLVKDDSITGLAAAISSLIEDSSLMRTLADEALTSIEEFSPGKIYSKWENIIKVGTNHPA